MFSRMELARQLVYGERLPSEILADLSRHEWDSAECLSVGVAPFFQVLGRYLSGELSSEFILEWANAIEMRDDLDFEKSVSSIALKGIYELANPDVEGPITEARVANFLMELQGAWSAD